MDAENQDDLERARSAYQWAEQALVEHQPAGRAAFTQYQRALGLLHAAPFVRDDDERAGLAFLLGLSPDDVDPVALPEGVARLRAEVQVLLFEREADVQRRALRGWRQSTRLVGSALVAIVLGVSGYTLARRALEPADLAAGKPWSASSVWAACDPRAGLCGHVRTRALFVTKEDDSPWFRIDLQKPMTFSGATILNRSDDAPERAVPLVLEAGDDGETFREVARRDSLFSTWRPSFAPVTARYVRLRVARKSYLHLESVKVHP